MQRQDKHFLPLQTIIYNIRWEGKQLTSVTDGTHSYSYSYNEDGLRLRKVVDGTDTEYYYNGSVLMYMVTGSGSTAVKQRFSYDAAGNLVAVVYKVGSGTSYIYYYLRNAQGDVVKMIDSSGNTVVEYLYDSWGKLIATTGSLANTVGANQPFRYRGYVYDEETGWYYLQSRYYDPTTCRFISADVLLSTGQGVIGHNSFAYCGNNPVARIDSEGNFFFTIVGAITGAIGGAISSAITGGNVWQGMASGAVSGAIAGAGVDITVATGGAGAIAIGIVAASGAVSGAAGQFIEDRFKPKSERGGLGDYLISATVGCVMNLVSFGMGGGVNGAKQTLKEFGYVATKDSGIKKVLSYVTGNLKAVGKSLSKLFSKNSIAHIVKSARSLWGGNTFISGLGGFSNAYCRKSWKYTRRVLFGR